MERNHATTDFRRVDHTTTTPNRPNRLPALDDLRTLQFEMPRRITTSGDAAAARASAWGFRLVRLGNYNRRTAIGTIDRQPHSRIIDDQILLASLAFEEDVWHA